VIDLSEALELIEAHALTLAPRRIQLCDAFGLTLASPVIADVDSPSWDRAMMDGFAVCNDDFIRSELASPEAVSLEVIADVAAGDPSSITIRSGTCARIMTGAPLPTGADSVVPIECARGTSRGAHTGSTVTLADKHFHSGQHVAIRGTFFGSGKEVMSIGMQLGAAEIGLATEAGATHVTIHPRARVSICSTGSELVEPSEIPAFGQTRNSNGPMISAAVQTCFAEPIPLGIAIDHPEAIRATVAQGLAADVLILSGGVSAGDYDLVPNILSLCGVTNVFHKVRLKPGKPVWFGVLDRDNGPRTLVFGLPGNPGSSLVCFELFVRPALAKLHGHSSERWHMPRVQARLTGAVKLGGDRPVFSPCRLSRSINNSELWTASPMPWGGSSDLIGFCGANGFLVVPVGVGMLPAGSEITVAVRDQPMRL